MVKKKVLQVRPGESRSRLITVPDETLLHLSINRKLNFDFMLSPLNIREFVLGHLLAEGFIHAMDEIKLLVIRRRKEHIAVNVNIVGRLQAELFRRSSNGIIWTECGSPPPTLKRRLENIRPVKTQFELMPEQLFELQARIRPYANRTPAGMHYAAILSSKIDLGHQAIDIGRHNAVDKVIGMKFLNGERFENSLLYTTGRISSDIVMKCLRVQMPYIVSVSSALSGAIQLAKKYKLGLFGYCRGGQLIKY